MIRSCQEHRSACPKPRRRRGDYEGTRFFVKFSGRVKLLFYITSDKNRVNLILLHFLIRLLTSWVYHCSSIYTFSSFIIILPASYSAVWGVPRMDKSIHNSRPRLKRFVKQLCSLERRTGMFHPCSKKLNSQPEDWSTSMPGHTNKLFFFCSLGLQ